MPEECASMRSMARWVLPVLVGPSTAVTPAPRSPECRLLGEEKEIGIDDRDCAALLLRDATRHPAACGAKFGAWRIGGLSRASVPSPCRSSNAVSRACVSPEER